VVKQLARGNAGQFTSLPERTLDGALDTLWSRGVTSTRPRNLLIVAREFEKQVTQALLAALPDAEVAALLAWRNDPQAGAERDALVGTYKAEVKGSGARGDPDAGAAAGRASIESPAVTASAGFFGRTRVHPGPRCLTR
jgi:hypothetical protein